MKFVTPKQTMSLDENVYGPDTMGIHVKVMVTAGTKWSCRKVGKYYHLTRRGTGVTIRCTESALNKHFEEIEGVVSDGRPREN